MVKINYTKSSIYNTYIFYLNLQLSHGKCVISGSGFALTCRTIVGDPQNCDSVSQCSTTVTFSDFGEFQENVGVI